MFVVVKIPALFVLFMILLAVSVGVYLGTSYSQAFQPVLNFLSWIIGLMAAVLLGIYYKFKKK